jgi:NADP-dependent 3-hydroxy acid dehydrogenase YdfG
MNGDGHDRVALITGATGALGPVAARRFAADAWRVALVGRDASRLEEIGGQLGVSEDRWMAVPGELNDGAAAAAISTAVLERWGRIDALLHLVGGWAGGTPVVDLNHGEVREMIEQHLWTTLRIVQAVVPGMLERGEGRVLAVSSPFAGDPRAKGASYAIGKAAEETLLRTLAREVAGSGVTVNLVLVRTIDAENERETNPTPKNASWTTPGEIGEVLAFLASPGGATVNGARIALDGRA